MNDQGFVIVRSAIPEKELEAARRLLLLDVVRRGLPLDQIVEWHNNKCWFPHLRWEPEITSLAGRIDEQFKSEIACEAQILLHFPDAAVEWPIQPHLDEEPFWAEGRKYTNIVGVALTPNNIWNGGFVSWGFDGKEPQGDVDLAPGDYIAFDPKLYHSGGLNRGGDIRMMVYFRFLGEKS